MKSARFIDEESENNFNKNGLIHIRSFLEAEELDALRQLFHSSYNYKGEQQGMWNSLFNIAPEKSAQLSNSILTILQQKLAATFTDYSTPMASFMVKNPNPYGVTNLHRDYSVQDEAIFQYRNIWIPLVDTTPANGALYALRYSHQFFDYALPMFCKWSYMEYQEMLFKNCDIVDAKAGDLVVYADRTLHGSFINQTIEPRPVVHFGLLHPEAEICYYYLDETTHEVTVYEVPFSFYFENKFGNQNGRFPVRSRFAYAPPVFTKSEIMEGLKLS